MSNLTFNQKIAIVLVILSVLTTSTVQMTELFGAPTAKLIATASGMLSTLMSGVLAVVTGQASLVKDVQAMPGVEKIVVNSQANKTLASVAVDPSNAKVEALPEAQRAVEATAKS